MSRTSGLGKAVAAAWLILVLLAPAARALFVDEEQNWSFRLRAYSQGAIRLQNSRSDKVLSPVTGDLAETQTVPDTKAGQLIQNRFFVNPELDVKLTPYLKWMKKGALSWLAPEDLRMRVAGWGFYDGVYDYGAKQFNDTQKLINENYDPFVPFQTSRPDAIREGGWFFKTRHINLTRGKVYNNLEEIFPGHTLKNPRKTYAHRRRLNELYLSYSKGPVFLRVGKQTISWGESDTIALLDQTNPFGVLLGAPGFFQDIDEARIPLWTVRASYDLFSTWGPFSSAFVEAYWVPGVLDTNVGVLPILTASPYSAPGPDPGRGNPIFPSTFQFILADQLPTHEMKNSRYGFRVQAVFNRFLTLQAWFYRTFPQQPVPLKMGFEPGDGSSRDIQIEDSNGRRTNLFIVSLQHKLTSVYGLSGTFFAEPLDGIIRINTQLFQNEPGFIPEKNLRIGTSSEATFGKGELPLANVLRYEIGFDRFFFWRAINPSNSFILSTSLVGSYNLDHTSKQDFRFAGLTKRGIRCNLPNADPNDPTDINRANACRAAGGSPTQLGNEIDDYIQQKQAEAQAQITLQSDWLHGKVQPRLTVIGFTRGTWAVHPSLTYRWNDYLLFGADFQWIGGAYQSLGIFQDRGQLSARVTYQLN